MIIEYDLADCSCGNDDENLGVVKNRNGFLKDYKESMYNMLKDRLPNCLFRQPE